ncbi:MAG: elongation factor G [Myxococcales bacterium]|jgi:elongation factor G|nr:elongation factor G [Myxococcales bacterium]
MKKYETKNIRNVCLVGHGGSGKTSLAEAILFNTGATNRLGSVLDQTSNFDFEPEEIKRASSISTAFGVGEWNKKKIQLLDTPGDGNFFVDARNALSVSDIAVVTISAVDGIQVMTEKMYALTDEFNIPQIIAINKMDRERANFHSVVESARNHLSKRIAPFIIPIGAEDNFKGVVNVIRQKAYMFPADGSNNMTPGEIPADMLDEVAAARETVIEVIAESDDDLMEKYLETMELTEEEINTTLPKAMRQGMLVPAIALSATRNVGIQPMLDMICDRFPSPEERVVPEAEWQGEPVAVEASASAPFAATVFKTVQDKFTGSLSICRVWSGTIDADSTFYNATRDERERFGQILVPMGKKQESTPQAGPGDIIAFAKLKNTKVGDTICDEKKKLTFPPLPEVNSLITYAISAKDKNEEDKLGQALNRIHEEDPTLKIIRNAEVHQTQIAGMGQVHIDVTIEKIKRKFDVEVELSPPRIPYRETIRKRVENIEGKHKKQSGGRGQFGVCFINVEPFADGDFDFVNSVVGGSIPRQWIPSVEKGIVDRMKKGVIAGYPLVGVRVEVFDGKYHDVDSSDAAFQLAGSKGFRAAVAKADPVLLEPIWNIEVQCPSDSMGDVMGDISSRRGRVLGMEAKGASQLVKAQAPMSELLLYAPDLNSMTGGRGDFTVSFSHYEELPRELQEKVMAGFTADDDDE